MSNSDAYVKVQREYKNALGLKGIQVTVNIGIRGASRDYADVIKKIYEFYHKKNLTEQIKLNNEYKQVTNTRIKAVHKANARHLSERSTILSVAPAAADDRTEPNNEPIDEPNDESNNETTNKVNNEAGNGELDIPLNLNSFILNCFKHIPILR